MVEINARSKVPRLHQLSAQLDAFSDARRGYANVNDCWDDHTGTAAHPHSHVNKRPFHLDIKIICPLPRGSIPLGGDCDRSASAWLA